MRIGTMVDLTTLPELAEGLKRLTTAGFDSCQLCAWHPEVWTKENAAAVREMLDTAGVTVSAFWCGWEGPRVWDFVDGPKTLGLVPAQYRAMRVRNLCDGADFAHSLGITDVATHMGFIPEDPNDPVFLPFCGAVRTVAEHLRANGQRLLFESGQETPVAMLRCFETVGTDNLGVNLDTGNLILYGKVDPAAALDVIGPYVRNLHIKDGRYPADGTHLGAETRIGEGSVDFRRLFVRLRELGYDSWATIEREISGPEQTRDILAAKAYLETLIGEVYGGDTVC